MGPDEALLEVGRVRKPHGLRGELVVTFFSDLEARREPGAEFETDRGRLRIVSARPHQDHHIVAFDGVSDRTAADELRGPILRAEPIDDPDLVFAHEVVGRRLVDADGVDRGEIVGMEANPAADLLVLDDGRVVPLNFVVEIGAEAVTVDTPPGLFDL